MKRITIELRDDEWKELSDTLQHELGKPLGDNEVEQIVKKDVRGFIIDMYVRGYQ